MKLFGGNCESCLSPNLIYLSKKINRENFALKKCEDCGKEELISVSGGI